MDRYLLPSHLITSQAHWDAMADIIGDDEATELYGPRPERYNSAEAVERLYFDDKAPRRALIVVAALTVALAAIVVFGALRPHRSEPTIPVELDPCALVLTHSGQECR